MAENEKRVEIVEPAVEAIFGGVEGTSTCDHATCPLCHTEVYFTNGITMESHQKGLICKKLSGRA